MARTDTLPHFLTDVANAIRTKAGTSGTIQASAFDTAIANIPSGGGTTEAVEKDINFYDYDGTRVYSYTNDEFMELSEMPANPSHTGLTAEGWNISYNSDEALGTIQDFITAWGLGENTKVKLDIGQTYCTDDDSTRIYVDIPEHTKTITLVIEVEEEGATIDWGDGSTPETVYPQSGSGDWAASPKTPHTYANAGQYTISIDGVVYLWGDSTYGSILLCDGTNNKDRTEYQRLITKIECGSNTIMDIRCFNSLINLEALSISKAQYDNGVLLEQIDNCLKLKCLIIPFNNDLIPQVTNCNIEVFSAYSEGIDYLEISNCKLLKRLSLYADNGGVIIINAFHNLPNIIEVNFINQIENIPENSFLNCHSLKAIRFGRYQFNVPTLEDINAFSGLPSDYKIYVPESLYEDWIGDTNWEDIADHIIAIPDI